MSGGFAFQIKVSAPNALRRYGQRALVRAKKVVEVSEERVYQTAQGLCPVDTGYMKAHMRKDRAPDGFGFQVGFEAQDFPAAFYPLFTEFGTRFMSAQPCIIPAGEVELPRFQRGIAEALRPSRGAQPPGKR